MKKIKVWAIGLAVITLVSLPGIADARGGGSVFLGFGAGLLTGYLFAPRPVYVAPPVYAAPPPAAVYPSPPPVAPPGVVVPPPAEPPLSAGPSSAIASEPPPPGPQAKCREWKMVERRLDYRWDSYSGRYRELPLEKWDWVEVPCSN